MKQLIFILFFVSNVFVAFAQEFSAPNTYRSEQNNYYWKNRKPNSAYWQQDVHCQLKANIDETTDIISGSEQLTYWNNSPDELSFMYFHLYQNAFQPGSYAADLQKNNNVNPKFGKYEAKKLGTDVAFVKANGVVLKTELDNTILKVWLQKPLKSGESLTFDIDFKTYFDAGTMRRRMKKFNADGYTHYDGVHWYPRIAVYDAKFGWDTQQHLGKEFYGEYGAYDVALTFSDNYVVEATGVLQNRAEVLPDALRQKLDIKNFAKKPWGEKSSEITPYNKDKRKTWIYHAENVHDFAFTADPTYRIGEAFWNGIQCIGLVQEPHASGWQNAADYTAKVIKTYSEDFGMYAYPKMVCADARDGMEYPMLTLDGGSDPGYRQLIAHEVGHNWFFGMVGNNETYRAMLDEGFTQFLTSWACEKIDGPKTVEGTPKNKYVRKFRIKDDVRDTRVYNSHMWDVVNGTDEFLNTHSDGFNGALDHGGGYRSVYYKTAAMLYNLQYVLGDSLFKVGMQGYFNQWKIAHPYIEDMRSSFIQHTKVDLNWFFDQWIETQKEIDYGIRYVTKTKFDNEYVISFKRYGRMQMPIDFSVITKKDSVISYHIPNNWFVKNTKANVLPRWIGWDKLQPEYIAKIQVPDGLKKVVIDPSGRLADGNMLNNSSKTPVKCYFDSKIQNIPSWKVYTVKWRPDVWYNSYDGVKAGLHFNGSYYALKHLFDANVWYNTGVGQYGLYNEPAAKDFSKVNFRFNYRSNAGRSTPKPAWNIQTKYLDGLYSGILGTELRDKKLKNKVYAFAKVMYRPSLANNGFTNYLLYPTLWQADKWNNTLNIGFEHPYTYVNGNGLIDVALKQSALGSAYSFSTLTLSTINRNRLDKLEFNTRFIAQATIGSNMPFESALYVAGANPEQLMDNKYTRAAGIVPSDWTGYGIATNHFNMGGGLGLRGYNGYLLPVDDANGIQRYVYAGTSGAALNAELEFDNYINLKPKFTQRWLHVDAYVFADAGVINTNKLNESFTLSTLKVDAGLGLAFTIKKFGPLQIVDPLTIRFDMPLFLNNPPFEEDAFFKFRWLVGVAKSF